MDFWARLIGSAYAPRKPAPKPAANDPQARLARFRRVYNTILELCNRPRNPANEAPLLDNLRACLDRIAVLIREETRAPVPHSCLQFARTSQIFAVIARAATVSQYEPIIRASIAVLAALVDSEEEDFLSSGPFAKSLMRLVTRVVDSGNVLISVETETAILELLFTIAAKIRLQPEILPVWFQSTAKPELEDVFVQEKKSFVGITQKDDFPLCYLLIDRVHHEGRIGDFARTGLLYIFEATGRSEDLEQWVVSSDLPTLMASGLGALYSQLSRELSILHPDATLPAVLAMSDYSTTHTRATAESAFSEKHKTHMATFLSYLAFWQDVLDHCRSSDVRQTLLDHFQILFLQQLLYPSLLQSSDTDAGSSVAVLTYMTAMLESLEYPDLIHMILIYLLAIQDQQPTLTPKRSATSKSPVAPRSPNTLKRRQSLILLNAPKNPDDAVEPTLFNLVDLIINNVKSKSSQTVYAALRLTSTIISRQKSYAFGTLLKVEKAATSQTTRTMGALDVELEQYARLAVALHRQYGLNETYLHLCEDLRYAIESQAPPLTADQSPDDQAKTSSVGTYVLLGDDLLMRTIFNLLRTFFTNSIDVNLALTHTIISIALSADVRLDNWVLTGPSGYHWPETSGASRPWQASLDDEERQAWSAVQRAAQRPTWRADTAPTLCKIIQTLVTDLDSVRRRVPTLDQLIAGRKNMLQAASLDGPLSEPPSMPSSPTQAAFLDLPRASRESERPLSSALSTTQSRDAHTPNLPPSRTPAVGATDHAASSPSPTPVHDLFRPPPPETPTTTDILMQPISFGKRNRTRMHTNDTPEQDKKHDDDNDDDKNNNNNNSDNDDDDNDENAPVASLNHVLTNVVVLQEFILELVAVIQIRAAVLGDREVRCSSASAQVIDSRV